MPLAVGSELVCCSPNGMSECSEDWVCGRFSLGAGSGCWQWHGGHWADTVPSIWKEDKRSQGDKHCGLCTAKPFFLDAFTPWHPGMRCRTLCPFQPAPEGSVAEGVLMAHAGGRHCVQAGSQVNPAGVGRL